MSSPALEKFLARLYIEPALREQFLAAPRITAGAAGLTEHEVTAMENIDRAGLLMASDSFERKRAGYRLRAARVPGVLRRWAERVRFSK